MASAEKGYKIEDDRGGTVPSASEDGVGIKRLAMTSFIHF